MNAISEHENAPTIFETSPKFGTNVAETVVHATTATRKSLEYPSSVGGSPLQKHSH